jgi:hypothetical protein
MYSTYKRYEGKLIEKTEWWVARVGGEWVGSGNVKDR